jgi:hypothetical protein
MLPTIVFLCFVLLCLALEKALVVHTKEKPAVIKEASGKLVFVAVGILVIFWLLLKFVFGSFLKYIGELVK